MYQYPLRSGSELHQDCVNAATTGGAHISKLESAAEAYLSTSVPSIPTLEQLKPPTGRTIILLRNHKVEVSHVSFFFFYEKKGMHHERCMGRRWLLPVPINPMSMVSWTP